MIKVFYGDEELGEVLCNTSITEDEALELIGWTVEELNEEFGDESGLADWELLRIECV